MIRNAVLMEGLAHVLHIPLQETRDTGLSRQLGFAPFVLILPNRPNSGDPICKIWQGCTNRIFVSSETFATKHQHPKGPFNAGRVWQVAAKTEHPAKPFAREMLQNQRVEHLGCGEGPVHILVAKGAVI